MKTFVINLDRDTERLKSITAYLRQYSIPFERISAVDGKKLSEEELKKYYNPVKAKHLSHLLTLGEIGCALSHIRLYQRIAAEKIPFTLILEDDAKILPGLNAVMKELEQKLDPMKNDVVMVGPRAWKNLPENAVFMPKSQVTLCKTFAPYCTTAYIITYEAARRLADFLLPVAVVADDWKRFEMYGLVNMLSVDPQPVELAECSADSQISKFEVDRTWKGKCKFFLQRNIWSRIDSLCAFFYRHTHKF